MKIRCSACGTEINGVPEHSDGVFELSCPTCGAGLPIESPPQGYETSQSDLVATQQWTTLFQPGVMVDTILKKESPPSATGLRPGLRLKTEEGEDRWIPLQQPITRFGYRASSDPSQEVVHLPDPSLAEAHFQIEILGREVFVRLLDQHQILRLNGHPIRNSQLQPGDELALGSLTLLFELSS